MTKSREYIKNTGILLLGKFTTQFMSFLLLPLYTKRLATSDYGTVDLIQTYITLLIPIITLRLDSATFRFLIDHRKDEAEAKKTITNVLALLFGAFCIAAAVSLVLPLFVTIPHYPLICANILVMIVSSIFLQILRGLGKNKHYAIASIITGVGALIINIIQIAWMGHGAESILVSATIANIFCALFAALSIKLPRYFSSRLIDRNKIKEFLKYSLPMIPNSLSWWVVNVSDRTLIRIFLGAAYNGIYTVSCKFSNILNSVFSIFNMSWQESASLHINDKDCDEFFSRMINQLLLLFSSIALLILVALPVFWNVVIGENYWNSYDYIPVLLYANSWNVLISLIGGIYVAKKKTKEIASTTIFSAIINLVVNFALIKFIGLHAATISTLVSYMAMAIYRAIDCQKYVKYKMDIAGFSIFTAVFVVSSVLYFVNNPILNIVNILLAVLYIFLANRKNLHSILQMIKSKHNNKHIID